MCVAAPALLERDGDIHHVLRAGANHRQARVRRAVDLLRDGLSALAQEGPGRHEGPVTGLGPGAGNGAAR